MPATDGTWRIATLRDAARNWLAARLLKHRRPAMRSIAATDVASPSETILQQLTRVRTAEGRETIRGTLAAEFPTGERIATLYVAFCPPFETLPDVEAHVADEPLATVNVVQRLHNGVQLDVHLPEPAEEPIALTIEFHAAAAQFC